MYPNSELRNQPDYEADDEDALQDDEFNDESFLHELSQAIHAVFKTHKGTFFPYFEQLLPALQSFLSHPDPGARHWAICVFDDLIEFAGPDSVKYQPHFLAQLASSLADPDADVRQAACYGIGVAALNGGGGYTTLCTGIIF